MREVRIPFHGEALLRALLDQRHVARCCYLLAPHGQGGESGYKHKLCPNTGLHV